MRTLLLPAALLAAGIWAASPAAAQQGDTPQQAPTMGSPAAGTAAQGGEQGNCPAGQVRNPNGDCVPGQSNVTGTVTGSGGGADMPASPHQQELLKGQQGSEPQPQPK